VELKEIEAAFQTAKVLLVEVEDLDEVIRRSALHVIGDFAKFSSAVTSLRIPAVFFSLDKLDASAFAYSPDSDDSSTEFDQNDVEEEASEQDLCAVDSELRGFKQYIGSIGRILMFAPTEHMQLTYVIEKPWFSEFWECRKAAVSLINQRDQDSQATLIEEEDKQLSEVTARLDDLLNDNKFARLPTQKAMLAYAKLHISGLDEVDEGYLKEAISNLRAKIIAKGAL
jgi:hypothetical protein